MNPSLSSLLGGNPSELGERILGGVTRVFFIQVGGLSLALILNVIWVRFLGPVDFGHYSFALSWVNILAVVGSMGWGTAVIRLVPKLRVEDRPGELSGLVAGSLSMSAMASLVIGGLYILVIPGHFPEVPFIFHAATALLIMPVSLLLVASGVAKGFNHVAAAQTVQLVFRTTAMLVLIGVVWIIAPHLTSAMTGLTINLVATTSALVVLIVLIYKRNLDRSGLEPREYRFNRWFRYSLPLFLIITANIINSRVGILATGIFLGPESTGQYAACVQISMLAGFGLMVVGMVSQPILSELFSRKDFEQINYTLKLTARGALLVTIPVTFAVLVGGRWLLEFMSDSYAGAYPVLVVLTMGQVVSVLSGQVGTLLVMTDMQRTAMIILITSSLVHIVLLYLLVPSFGMMGAGVSAGLTTLFWNSIMAIVVWNRMKLRAMAI